MPKTIVMTPALQALLVQQDNVATAEQLAAYGVTPNAVQHRVGTGKWCRILPGVVLTTGGEPTRRQRVIAAWLWAGEDSAIDGVDACAWYGLRPEGHRADLVHVVVEETSNMRTRGFVIVRRSSAEIIVGDRGRVPYVDRGMAVVVAAREANSVGSAISVLSRALQTHLVDVAMLHEARERLGDKWCARVDTALLAVGVGVRSPAEKTAHDLILTSEVLPAPMWNQWLDLGDGGCPVCVDALWKDAGMVNEVLGRKYHAWGDQFESTEARRSRLVSAGLVVQGSTAVRLRTHGQLVLASLEQTYALNAGRGMPANVRLIDPPFAIAA